MPEPTADRQLKHARLVQLLDARGADRIHLGTPEALAWYFDGPRTGVPLGGAPVFSATVHRDGTAVIRALANEAQRLAEEEIGGAEFEVIDWFGDLQASEPGVLRDTEVASELRAARAALLPVERARYAALGRDMATALTRVLSAATPTMTERELAGALSRAIYEAGAEPAVTLVAGASRAHVQHPLPTDAPLGSRAMGVITGRRHGLHVSATRWVQFSRPSAQVVETERRLFEVEADVWAATRPDRTLDEVLGDIRQAYARHGFGDDAWRKHHQGGPTGYNGRDPKAAPGLRDVVQAGQAFAWNPWAFDRGVGGKSEDTVVIDAGGSVVVLSADPAWPTLDIRGVARPAALDLF
ncbi:M24 family metallopeptidase [Microbacterium stercoris]|uniref:M24 family metallopeptidase n=1 Tax=Microbacterium stercoris TaxID=2820289 RepID=UPI001F29EF56|nr:M24 family metallopeptidase [Microbacterium stercoris]